MTKYQAIFQRFCKGFIASAIPTIVAALAGVTQFNNTTELKAFSIGLAVPLITGLLLSLEKAINWVEPEKPIEIEDLKSSKKKSTPKTA